MTCKNTPSEVEIYRTVDSFYQVSMRSCIFWFDFWSISVNPAHGDCQGNYCTILMFHTLRMSYSVFRL